MAASPVALKKGYPMLHSFFPQPKIFFPSAVAWALFAVMLWYLWGQHFGAAIGLPPPSPDAPPNIWPSRFLEPDFAWFYIYFWAAILIFYAFWAWYSPHPWQDWSVLGSGLIIFVINFNVQVSVVLNDWRGVFYDMVQQRAHHAGFGDRGPAFISASCSSSRSRSSASPSRS